MQFLARELRPEKEVLLSFVATREFADRELREVEQSVRQDRFHGGVRILVLREKGKLRSEGGHMRLRQFPVDVNPHSVQSAMQYRG